MGRAEVPRDGSSADLQREVGDDDAEIPVTGEQLPAAGGEDLRQRGRRNDQTVDLETPGTYQVTVYDTDEAIGIKPVKAEIRVDAEPVVSVGTGSATVYFNSADPPTVE